MSILERIKRSIPPGEVLYMPSRKAPFTVEYVDAEGVTFCVGEGKWKIKGPSGMLGGHPWLSWRQRLGKDRSRSRHRG